MSAGAPASLRSMAIYLTTYNPSTGRRVDPHTVPSVVCDFSAFSRRVRRKGELKRKQSNLTGLTDYLNVHLNSSRPRQDVLSLTDESTGGLRVLMFT